MNISIIESMEQMPGLSGAWNDLLRQSLANNVFLTWEWAYSWAETYIKDDRRLFVITIEENGELIGIAPFCIRRVRTGPFLSRRIEFLGTPEAGADYLDVFVKKGREKTVSSLLYRYLFQRCQRDWDALYLQDIPAGSLFMSYFINELKSAGRHFEIERGSYCPIVVLPGSQDEFDQNLSRNRRQQYQRHKRLLENKYKADFEHLSSKEIILADTLTKFADLYEDRWKSESGDLFRHLRNFIQITKEDGIADIDLLKIDGNYVGGLLHLNYNHVKYMYLMAIHPSTDYSVSIGNVMCAISIKRAIEEKCKEYDFLKGEEPYKFQWMNYAKTSYFLIKYRSTFPSIFVASNKYMKNIFKIIFRNKVAIRPEKTSSQDTNNPGHP
jgi:CelD/BcsL family acetyltransferase involved in cellulose biosynthesis